MNAFPALSRRIVSLLLSAATFSAIPVFAAETTNTLSLNTPMPDMTGSMIRVFGALALVLAIFLGGVWLFRNWQRFTIHRGNAPKLNIVESRSLGGRHALYVVGYENERFLISSSPTGINMLTHLRSAEETPVSPTAEKPVVPQATFAQTLAQMLKGNRKPE